jgi:hypothetical protein
VEQGSVTLRHAAIATAASAALPPFCSDGRKKSKTMKASVGSSL